MIMTPISEMHVRALRGADRLVFHMNRPDIGAGDHGQWVEPINLWLDTGSGLKLNDSCHIDETRLVPLGEPTVSLLDKGTFGTGHHEPHPLVGVPQDDLYGIVPVSTDDAITRTWLGLIRSGDELAVHFRPIRKQFIHVDGTVVTEERADLTVTRPTKTGTRDMKFFLSNRIFSGNNGASDLVYRR